MGTKYSRAGKVCTIEAEVEVEVDELLEYATDECLIDEVNDRKLDWSEIDLSFEEVADMLCSKLDIVRASELRDVLTEFIPMK